MAKITNLTAAEESLAKLVWKSAPMPSSRLIELANQTLEWKKSTTYTILKRLCEKGVFKNENAVVTVLITHEALVAQQSRRYVEDTFGGSLPRFIASFIGSGKKLTAQQAAEIKQIVAEYEGDDDE